MTDDRSSSRTGGDRRGQRRGAPPRRSDDRNRAGRSGGRGRPQHARYPQNRGNQSGRTRTRDLPPLPVADDIDPDELDRSIAAELRTLPKSLADKITGHLIMVGRELEGDPQTAAAHARRAYDLAPRVPSIREVYALAAYRSGDYKAALREARTVRRMRGDDSWLAIIGDCERGLGRPERAITLLNEPPATLEDDQRAEVEIVLSGAYRDTGDEQAALATFDDALLRTAQNQVWAARYRYAYSEQLRRMGEKNEADKWLQLAIATDPDNETGALDRLAEVAPELA